MLATIQSAGVAPEVNPSNIARKAYITGPVQNRGTSDPINSTYVVAWGDPFIYVKRTVMTVILIMNQHIKQLNDVNLS